jgi:hypothetical protein
MSTDLDINLNFVKKTCCLSRALFWFLCSLTTRTHFKNEMKLFIFFFVEIVMSHANGKKCKKNSGNQLCLNFNLSLTNMLIEQEFFIINSLPCADIATTACIVNVINHSMSQAHMCRRKRSTTKKKSKAFLFSIFILCAFLCFLLRFHKFGSRY